MAASIVLGVVSCSHDETISENKSKNVRYLTEAQFLRYIKNNYTDVMLADFDGIDVSDFIHRSELTKDSIGIYLKSRLERYEFDLVYPNHTQFTSEEFLEVISTENKKVSASDFDDVDIDGFLSYVYNVRREDLTTMSSYTYLLYFYREWLDYHAGNYTYLRTSDRIPLLEDDIPNMARLYVYFILGGPDGLNAQAAYLFDFEENTLAYPEDAIRHSPVDSEFGIYVRKSAPRDDLPDDAKKRISELLIEHGIANLEHPEYSVTGGWELCIELRDGRIARYSAHEETSALFSGFTGGLQRFLRAMK